jgi:hypothetical protein
MVELSQYNMFANGVILNFSDGTQKLQREPLVIIAKEGDDFHTVKEGDRLEQIAWLYWNKKVANAQFYWWVIRDANNVKNPLDLSTHIGNEILVPDILRIKIEFDI